MKDMDDMDAYLFASKKTPNSAPKQTQPFGIERPNKDSPLFESNVQPEGEEEPPRGGKKPISLPSSTKHSDKKFTFSDSGGEEDDSLGQTSHSKDGDDPVADLLNETKTESKSTQSKPEKSMHSSLASSVLKPNPTKAEKKGQFTFDDDKDDIIDALGFDGDKNKARKNETPLWSAKEREKAPQRARTRIDEILESFTSSRHLGRPPTGERKDEKQQLEKTSAAKESHVEDDLTFGSYQPTLGYTAEGHQSRRQSVRFSTEDISVSTPEKKLKPTTPTSSRHRSSADWLGLKSDSEFNDLEDDAKDSPKPPSSPVLERKSLTGSHSVSFATVAANGPMPTDDTLRPAKYDVSKNKGKEVEEGDDWLAGMLSRRKALSDTETKTSKQEDCLALDSVVSKQTPKGKEDSLLSVTEASPAVHSTPIREEMSKQAAFQQNQMQTTAAAAQQAVLPPDILQQLLLQQQMMQSQLLSLRLKDEDHRPVNDQTLENRIIQLEGQVKTLQLERDQSQMVLENIQQRHKQDMEILENTQKAHVTLLEDSVTQRETRAQQECEELMERLAAVTRSAEQERLELQTQYQRKLAQAQQDRDREVERLRELQRKSIMEVKKDHEDQIQRLKRLKDEEIDAVTSATSQTRSLTVVIEQMEQFSSRLGELSSRVESTHEHTVHGLGQEARHRDEQLRTMQDRLAQQQRAIAEERAYLKEIISRMDTQLNEQQRQLEKERWKMTAEQAKVESTQRSLEEERRVFTMQISMEREELERAKSALLEEQKSVMQHCTDERRKLAAEWAQFHAQEKQRHERAEREVSSFIEKREGSIISMAQEQADLKLRLAELKQTEMAMVQEQETLDRLREEMDREKERISSTGLRLKTRAQEVEAFSKLATEKYEEGERALQEAKRVEAEHEARLRNIHSQTEKLRQHEQRMLKDQMRLNNLAQNTERLKKNPSSTHLPQIIPELPIAEPPATVNTPPPVSVANSQSMALQASLALWRYIGEKDREYFQEEQIFLENLKKKSYRSPYNID
ncbi:fas-binding factor 1 homolog isoform 2-T2 [Pholidichthys leucotaenia]